MLCVTDLSYGTVYYSTCCL